MINEKTMFSLSEIENEILELIYDIDNHEIEVTTSDLQGIVQAQVIKAYLIGKGGK